MKIQVICQDKHEATKLASLIYIKDGNETYISSILNIYENEVVIALKDKSAHSVVFKDTEQVNIFADFIQSVLDDVHHIKDTKIVSDIVEIVKG